MIKKEYALDDLMKKKIACIGIGRDFWSFFNGFYGSALINNIVLCIDNNKENHGKTIMVGSREMTIQSVAELKGYDHKDFILLVMSVTYGDEIVKGLDDEKSLSEVEYMQIYDLYFRRSSIRNVGELIKENEDKAHIIPKSIHWCWFGGNPIPEREKAYIEGWKEKCPDYEIVLWDEKSFNIDSVPYVKEAYEARKWAFVTDYVRLWAIYNYGGIYMDADVEVVNNLDIFLCEHAFSGFEDNLRIPTGIMGGEKNSSYMGYLLSYYDGRHFLTDNGYDETTNVVTITNMTYEKYNVRPPMDFLRVDGEFTMYPREVFCPLNYLTGKVDQTSNTYAIHRFSGSWCK